MDLLFGLLAALGFGCGDFFARFASHKIGSYRTLLYMQVISFVALSIFLLLTQGDTLTNLPLWSVELAAFLGCIDVFATLALYRSFEIGTLSLVSPIAASYGAITLLLSITVSGEQPAPAQVLGLILTLIGVVLAAVQFPARRTTNSQKAISSSKLRSSRRALIRGTEFAVLAALYFGLFFWALRFVTPALGGIVPVWETRLVAPLLLLTLSRPLRQSVRLPDKSSWKWLLAIAVMDTLGLLSYSFGVKLSTQTASVAVLSSLFSAVTVLLARIFLREKLATNQWCGILCILIGVALVSSFA